MTTAGDAEVSPRMRDVWSAGEAETGEPGASRFRGDIEGMRAIAVGLVLFYHAGVPFLAGGFVGVDVFFVISGFLITSLLTAELGRTGRISLLGFYARRAKRLLPATALVLIVTAVLTAFAIPRTQWQDVGGDIIAAALYLINWRLADRSVDYLAEDSVASPVQHFWSLAVEEQFYLVWPLVVLAIAVLAKRVKRRPDRMLHVGLGLLVVPSFIWSIQLTGQEPTKAFFVSTTRIWELGVGALVAMTAGLWTKLSRRATVILGWTGLAAVLASGALFSTETAWPGYAALVPVLGAAAVIVAGCVTTREGPAVILSVAPLQWIGGLSYSLYLWHWPLIAITTAIWGKLTATQGVVVVMVSLLPAWLAHRAFENPIRKSSTLSRSPRFALSLGLNFSFAGVAAGLAILVAVDPVPVGDSVPTQMAAGAAVLRAEPRDDPAGAPTDEVAWMTPLPIKATADVHRLYQEDCQQDFAKTEVVTCEFGDPQGATRVAIVGDSKIAQWLPALEPIAQQSNWHLTTYLKSSCSFARALTTDDGKPFRQCRTWSNEVLERLTANPPDIVITSQSKGEALRADGTESAEAMVDALRAVWTELTAAGSKVVVIADNPVPGMNVYECVANNPKKMTACSFSRGESVSPAAVAQVKAAEGLAGVSVVDLNDAICPTERCAPVIGNVLIYRQGTHITATYIKSLTPRLAKSLTAAGFPVTYRGGA
ncbi:acyltransferase family protein [Hamadaea sp. NPDC050747]|uniref:acyltransferase family protein n=1 Tax=Hamadaea sp. NPDC050747 TaxID=3155789 RepID=UPI003402D5A8